MKIDLAVWIVLSMHLWTHLSNLSTHPLTQQQMTLTAPQKAAGSRFSEYRQHEALSAGVDLTSQKCAKHQSAAYSVGIQSAKTAALALALVPQLGRFDWMSPSSWQLQTAAVLAWPS